jgi:hypothetical protein
LSILSGAAATNTTSGAIVVSGGIGVSGNGHFGGDVFAQGVNLRAAIASLQASSGGTVAVDTIAGVKATPIASKVVTLTASGIGGVFVWDAACSETADDAIYIASNLSATGRWVRQYDGWIDVRWYGCKGDGVTDDWANFQRCIDAVAARYVAGIYSGGNSFPDLSNTKSPDVVVYVPSGIYNLSKTLIVKGLRLIGDGQAYYPDRWLSYASAANTIQGTIIQAIEPFDGSCLVDLLADNSHLSGITVDGMLLDRGTVVGMSIVGQSPAGQFGQKNGTLSNNRIIVSDKDDPRQWRCSIETHSLPALTPNFFYEEFLEGWSGPYAGATPPSLVWSIVSGSLPPGLSLESSTGKISGTFAPVNAQSYGDFSFTARLTAGTNTAERAFTIGVLTAYVEDKKLLTATVGRAYNYKLDLRCTQGTGQTISVSGAPSGLSIASNGQITYTPVATDIGIYEITINVTDTHSGKVRSRELSIEVVPQSNSLRIENIGETAFGWTVGTARTHQVWARGGIGTLTWSIDLTQTLSGFSNTFSGFPKQNGDGTWSPAPGLVLNPATGILSGTPTSSGRGTFYVKVVDSGNPVSTWIEPVILQIGSADTAPKILTRAFPSARRGVPYSFQLRIQNPIANMDFDVLPLPSGLTVSPTGLISGTPTGGSFVDGVNCRWSASIDNCNIRGFLHGAGIKAHGPTNLHRVSRSMIHRCDIGVSLAQCYDSHWEELYIYTNRVGIEMLSGAAAHNWLDVRIEFIYEAGVLMSYAGQNAFTSCYWDTCGTQGIVADGCPDLNLTGNRFFRSGRLVFGPGTPDDPKADSQLSTHIKATNCSDLVLSGNNFHVGSEAEGSSSVEKVFIHYDDFARPRHCFYGFDCPGLTIVGNNLLGSANTSIVDAGGLSPVDKIPEIVGNQVVVRHILERRVPKKIDGNLLRGGNYTPGSTATWNINTATTTTLTDGWDYQSEAYQSAMTISVRKNVDRSLPFEHFLRIVKPPEANPNGSNYQLGVLKNNTAASFTWMVVGETLLCSFYARARNNGGSLLTSLTIYPATDENSYGADVVFGSRIAPTTEWKRYTIAFDIPRYAGMTVGKNGGPALELKFIFDQQSTNYDLDLSGHQLEIQTSNAIASPLKLRQLGSGIPSSEKGAANGVAPLDANQKVPTQYLPAASGGGLQPADIGVTVQGYDADLQAIAALSPSNSHLLKFLGGAWTSGALLVTDIPNLDAAKISAGVFDNARINWASPGAIGGTTPSAAQFTSLTLTQALISPEGSATALTAATTIPTTTLSRQITSTSAITITATPSINTTGVSDGQLLILRNGNATNTITIQQTGTLAGSAYIAANSLVLRPGASSLLIYSAALSGWMPLSPGSLGLQNAGTAVITGGTIDGAMLGATTAASVRCTTLTGTSATDTTSTSTGGAIFSGGVGISRGLSIGMIARFFGIQIEVPSTAQNITAATTIAANASFIQISSTAAITMTSTLQIAAGSSGQSLTVYNSGSFAITFVDGNGLKLPSSTFVLQPQQHMSLYYAPAGRWQPASL